MNGELIFEITLFHIAVLIIVSRCFGEVFARLKLPAVAGEIITGILLGPAVLGLIFVNPDIKLFIALGIYFLLFFAGFEEIDLADLAKAMRLKTLVAAIMSLLVPFSIFLPFLLMYLGGEVAANILAAIVLALTSMGVVLRCVADFKITGTASGVNLVNMAMLNELFGLLAASLALEALLYPSTDEYYFLLSRSLKVIAFFFLAGLAGYYVVPSLIRKAEELLKIREASFAVLIASILVFSYGASVAGLHGVFGALTLGFALSTAKGDPIISKTVQQLEGFAHGIFIPIFFAGAGLYVTKDFLALSPLAILLLSAVIIGGKLLGGYIGSRILLPRKISGMVALGLLAKGGVELAILPFAMVFGALTNELYSFIVVLMILMMIVSAISIRALAAGERQA